MKTLVLILLCLNITTVFANQETCSIKQAAHDQAHPQGCVFSIVNESGTIVSECYSENDLVDGIVRAELINLQRNGVCSIAPCSIQSPAFDENHPTGCVYAIVDKRGKIISNCFSENDLDKGIVDMALKASTNSKTCSE